MRIISSRSLGLCALSAIVLSPLAVAAQSQRYVGERAQGMAGAFVAVADDASAVYWNPAGLPTGSTFDLQLGVTRLQDASDAPGPRQPLFVGAGMPPLGVAYYRLSSAVSGPDDRKNGGSGELRVSALDTGNFGVSLVQTIVSNVVIGTTLRVVAGADEAAFDLDLGAMASVANLRMGVMTRNLRQGLDTQRQVRAGAAFVPRSQPSGVNGPLSVAFDVDLLRTATPEGDVRQAAAGTEQWWVKGALGTRFGVHWNTLGEANPAIAAGLTVRLPHSLFVEGHVTKSGEPGDRDWGLGLRVAF